jgi:hypothetical protein
MNRREKIRLTLEQIKVTRSLIARLAEFIRLARTAGYEPAHSIGTLERIQSQLMEQRATLARLTINSQKEFVRRQAKPHFIEQKAA